MAEQQIDVQWSPGKARAFDTWLNQGRGIKQQRNMGRREVFRSGPMKGKTYDEARMGFERMWSTVDPAIRQKYEREAMGPDHRTATEMPGGNPSTGDRRGNAELNASRAGETYSQTVARQQAARAGQTVAMEPWQGGQAVGSGEQATAQQGRSFDDLTADPSVFSADGMQHSVGSGEPSRWVAPDGAIDLDNYTGQPVTPPEEKTPFEGAVEGTMGRIKRGLYRVGDTVGDVVKAPFTTRSERTVEREKQAILREHQKKARARDAEDQRRAEAENTERLRREAGFPPTAEQTPVAQPAQPAQPAPPALPPVPLRTGRGGRIAQTPEGMELVGMKSGTPQYAPIGEVYAGRTGDAPGPDGVGPVREMRPDADIRADYQRRMQPPPATVVQKPQAFPQGPASQAPTPYQSPPAGPDLYTPERQRDQARQARDAGTQGDYFRSQGNEEMARMFPNATENPPGLVAVGPRKPLDQLVGSRGTSAQSPYPGAPPRRPMTKTVRPRFAMASRR